MSTEAVTPIRREADDLQRGLIEDYGMTPEILAHSHRAATFVRRAIAATEAALGAATEGSDADARFNETLNSLENALWNLEWTPPAEH